MSNISAAFDISGLIAVIVFILIAGNVVREVIRQTRLQREQERERRMRGDAPPPRSPAQRQRPPAPKPQGDLQDFLDEIARRTGLPVPEHRTPPPPRPQQSQAPRQSPQPARQPQQQPQKVYRPKAIPAAPVRRKHAATVAGAKVVYEAKAPKALETAPNLEVDTEKNAGASAERIAGLLADRPLAHAVALRDILGPCRAMEPYRPGRVR